MNLDQVSPDQTARLEHLEGELGRLHPNVIEELLEIAYKVQMVDGRDPGEILVEALNRSLEALGQNHETTARVQHRMGGYLFSLEQYNNAIFRLERALQARLNLLGAKSEDTLKTQALLVACLLEVHRVGEAENIAQAASENAIELLGVAHPVTQECLRGHLRSVIAQSNPEKEIPACQRYLKSVSAINGPASAKAQECLNMLAINYSLVGQCQKATETIQSLIQMRTELYGQFHPETLLAVQTYGQVCDNCGQGDLAKSILEDLLKTEAEHLGNQSLPFASASAALGVMLKFDGQESVAIEHLLHAKDIFTEALGPQEPIVSNLQRVIDLPASQLKAMSVSEILRNQDKSRM